MIISEVNLKYFGKFNNSRFELKPGINLIQGNNEAGKTTIHGFIRAMYFGIKRGRGRAAKNDDYNKFLPWDFPYAFEGSLDFILKEKKYRIHRNFHIENLKFEVIEMETGEIIDLKDGDIQNLIAGFTESVFDNTISVGQLKVKTEKSLGVEIKNHMANLTTARDQEIDVGGTLTNLKGKKSLLEKSNTKTLVIETEEKLKETMDLKEEIKRLEIRLKASQEKTQNFEKEKSKFGIVKEAFEKDYRNKLPAVKEKFNVYQDLVKKEKEYQSLLNKTKKKKKHDGNRGRMKSLISIISLVIIIGLAFIFLNIDWPLLMFIAIIASLTLVAIFYRQKKTLSKYEKEYGEIVFGDLEQCRDRMDLLYDDIMGFTRKFLELDYISVSSMEKLEAEITQIDKEMARREQEIYHGLSTSTIEFEKNKWAIEKLEEKERFLHKGKDGEQLIKELQELNLKKKEEKIEIEAIEQATTIINNISHGIEGGFGKQLNEKTSKIFSTISKGKYDKVKIDKNLNGKVMCNSHLVEVDKLSMGSLEQVYLSLRLAVADLIFAENSMPIILDDSFALYDDTRLVQVLREIGARRQIIIFTCQKREKKALDKLNISYNYINL